MLTKTPRFFVRMRSVIAPYVRPLLEHVWPIRAIALWVLAKRHRSTIEQGGHLYEIDPKDFGVTFELESTGDYEQKTRELCLEHLKPGMTFVMGLALAAADVAANMTPSNSGRVELAVTPGADESALSAVGALGVGARFPEPSGRALCLPTRLRAAGYEMVALHGFTKDLFGRSRWYPHVGLPSIYFREELPVIGLSSVCGNVFPGICDDEIGRYIGRLLHAQPSPRLIYWLTLNSHVPAFLETGEPDIFLCTDRGGPFADISVCRLATKCRAVMKAVSRMATDPANTNVEFLIVGDHAPPIFSRKGRRMFESNVWSPGYSCGQARTRHRVPPALRPSHPGAGSKYSMSLNWSTNWLMRWSAIGFRKWRPCQRLARSD